MIALALGLRLSARPSNKPWEWTGRRQVGFVAVAHYLPIKGSVRPFHSGTLDINYIN